MTFAGVDWIWRRMRCATRSIQRCQDQVLEERLLAGDIYLSLPMFVNKIYAAEIIAILKRIRFKGVA